MKHQTDKSLLFVITAVLALAAAVTLYVLLYRQIGASVDRSRAALDIVQAEQSLQSQSKDLQTEYQSTAAMRARLPGLFVPAGNAVSFIETLESIGPASGAAVSISSINADQLDAAAPGTTGSISADISASGSWESVMRALVLSESLPYQNEIDHVSLTEESGAVGTAGATVTRNGVWHISYHISAMLLAGARSNP